MSAHRNNTPNISHEAVIESLSPEGRGVTHIDGKTTFVDGALPGETVRLRYLRRRRRHDEAIVTELVASSAARIEPHCRHFGACGGCRLQHMDSDAQIRHKEQALFEQLHHIGKVEPERLRPAITGPEWGYRHKARLGVKYVERKGRVLVGFRERNSRYVAELESCPVLHPVVGEQLQDLSNLIQSLSVYRHIPQIEIGIGESGWAVLVLRHLAPLTSEDHARLLDYEQAHGLAILLQPAGPDSIEPLQSGSTGMLSYALPDHGVEFTFAATDFTQVNPAINRALVNAVVEWMQPTGSDRLLDLFCGLGNFALPLARRAGWVTGVEGAPALVERARMNAERNGIANTTFISTDLMTEDIDASFMRETHDKVVLDPPRSGAAGIITALDWREVQRIAYVSCNPSSLARDAGMLVRDHGFVLKEAGVLDMFPHTAHVESLALFERRS